MSLEAKIQHATSHWRRYRRYHIPDQRILSVRPEGSEAFEFRCRVEDFSLGGCLVAGRLPASPGDTLPFAIEFGERPMFVSGHIRRMNASPFSSTLHWAIEFVSPTYARCPLCASRFVSPLLADPEPDGHICPECRSYDREPVDGEEPHGANW
jgi:hypothetical protein